MVPVIQQKLTSWRRSRANDGKTPLPKFVRRDDATAANAEPDVSELWHNLCCRNSLPCELWQSLCAEIRSREELWHSTRCHNSECGCVQRVFGHSPGANLLSEQEKCALPAAFSRISSPLLPFAIYFGFWHFGISTDEIRMCIVRLNHNRCRTPQKHDRLPRRG